MIYSSSIRGFFILLQCLVALASIPDTTNVLNACYSSLEEHLCVGTKWDLSYHFYRPSHEKYSADQWLWDSGAHMITWSHKNVTNSILDLRTMLQMQQEDGRIPEEIFWQERSASENALIRLQYSSDKYTDTTQMPVLPYSLRAIYNVTKDKELLKEFLYPIIDYYSWWRNTRDVDHDGLIAAIHNWETGLDASPAYDPAFHVYITDINETSLHSLYPKFVEIVESYKFIYKWNVTEILAREKAPEKPSRIDTWFVVKDLALNSVYASGWYILEELAKELGDVDTASFCGSQGKYSSDAIVTKMWDSEHQTFQTVYKDVDGINKFSIANSIQNMFPILLKDLPKDKIEFIVGQLKDSNKFYAPYSFPTVAMDDPQFVPDFPEDLMWRGPVWGFTNWFVMEGLGLHGYFDLQEDVLRKWINLVDKSGIYEMYNPLTGEPYGAVGLGMSTLVCDWVYRYGWN